MKIVYVANHDAGCNDDEGAITWALSRLGHDVRCLREARGDKVRRLLPADLLLFHKWSDVDNYRDLPLRKVFWYFDLVETDDASEQLQLRMGRRKAWMEMTLPHVDLGFCTDGDWVAKDSTGKLVWLSQGFDSRLPVCQEPVEKDIELLFVGGIYKYGHGRNDFMDWARATYGSSLVHVPVGVYREELAKMIARAKIVLAPDAPCSARYWSNRVYWMLGLGGFLLHPECGRLVTQYDGRGPIFYQSREHLEHLVGYWSADEREGYRRGAAQRGLAETLLHHTYLHRCHDLMVEVQRRLGVNA